MSELNEDEVVLHSQGVPVTRGMIEQWRQRWESGDYPGSGWGPTKRGPKVTVGDDDEPAGTITFRVGKKRKAKLEQLVKERGLKDRSEVLRQLIDAA
jgi:hypothetical protein